MSLGRCFRGVADSVNHLSPYWQGDIVTGFPARIKAIRKDGSFLWYLPSDEVEHERNMARSHEERLVKLIHDMYRTLKCEDNLYQIYGLHEKLERYGDVMEELGIEVDE